MSSGWCLIHASKSSRADSPSDATLQIYRRQRAEIAQTPPPVPPGMIAVSVNTTEQEPDSLDSVITALARTGAIIARIP